MSQNWYQAMTAQMGAIRVIKPNGMKKPENKTNQGWT
jgi:hypothetical protein